LTEESDALVIVVSEETGNISVAYKGRLRRGLDSERLERILAAVLLRRRAEPGAGPSRVRRLLELLRRGSRPRVGTRAASPAEVESHGT
jgi:hypothetical protein